MSRGSDNLPPHFALVFSTNPDHPSSSASSRDDLTNRLRHHLSTHIPHSHWGVLAAKPKWRQSALQESLDTNLSLGAHLDLEASLHALLDLLPGHLAFHLDVIWVAPAAFATRDTPVKLYGALKRAREWHGARVTLLLSRHESTTTAVKNDFLDDLKAEVLLAREVELFGEFLPKNLLWRGSLSFTDDGDGSVLRSLPEFELVAKDDYAFQTELPGARRDRSIASKRLARHLKVMAAVSLSKVPKDCLTDRLFILRTSKNNRTSVELLEDEALLGRGRGLIVKLQLCDVDHGVTESAVAAAGVAAAPRRRTTQEWRKAVANSSLDRCLDESMEKPLGALFFLVFSDDDEDPAVSRKFHEKVAVLLNSRLPGEDLSTDSEAVPADHHRYVPVNDDDLAVISEKIIGMSTPGDASSNDTGLIPDELEWDERRLLSFLDHQAKMNSNKTAISETMTPSGDFVILEAKELLKHFTADGLPRSENLEVLRPKCAPVLSDIEDVNDLPSWPHDFFLDYHGVHYNRCEQSEEADRESMRLQRLYIGSRETAATCCTLQQNNAKQIIVTKPLRNEAAKANTKESSLPRRSPRKNVTSVYTDRPRCSSFKAAAATAAAAPLQRQSSVLSSATTTSLTSSGRDSAYKQKLRNAVYEALGEKGIDERHKLFRNSFRKLFEICKMYGKDIPPNAASTKLWLSTVAKQNADTVVNLEIALNGK